MQFKDVYFSFHLSTLIGPNLVSKYIYDILHLKTFVGFKPLCLICRQVAC